MGRPYLHTISSSRGIPRGSFVVRGGALPPGLTLSGTGVLTGTPTTAGEFAVTVTASNGLFLPDASGEFTVVIVPANTAPVVGSDAYSTPEGSPLSVTAPAVLSNDHDLESDPLPPWG